MSQFGNVDWCDTFTGSQPFQPFFGFIFNPDEKRIVDLAQVGARRVDAGGDNCKPKQTHKMVMKFALKICRISLLA